MDALTVFCSLWKGWQPIYDHRHVNALERMLARYLPDARLVCFTSSPEGIRCETRPLPSAPALPPHRGRDCYWRTWFFSEECAQQFPGRIVNIDLDVLLLDSLEPLITDEDFRILAACVCPYNGGFWTHRTGTRTKVWTCLNKTNLRKLRMHRIARRWVGSDQAWLAYMLPGEATYTEADGVRFIMAGDHRNPEGARAKMDAARIVFFPGAPGVKPWSPTVQSALPFVYERYMEFFE